MVAVGPRPAVEPPVTGWRGRAKRFLTVAEVAAELGVSEPTLYRAVRAGEFPAVKIRGRYVIPTKALDQLEASAIATGLVDVAETTPERAERGWPA